MNRSFLIAIALVSCAFASGKAHISYLITPIPKEMVLRVEVEVTGIQVGSRPAFKISEQFGSADDFYNDVESLLVSTPSDQKLVSVSKTEWQLSEKATHDTLRFEYRIRVRQPSPGSIRFKPSLSADSYYSNGYPIFLFPDLPFVEASLAFKLPKGWSATTSLLEQNPNEWVAPDRETLLASTIALGCYRIHQHTLSNGTPLTIALNGKWLFTDQDFSSAAFKIISAQIQMMGTWHFPSYLVVLTQSTEKGSSGSGLTDAFEMFGHPSVKIEDLYYVLAHENFHYWNGYRIRYEAPKDRWFSEGFTDYFAFVTLGRLRLPSLESAILDMSKTIQDYYDNPVADSITFSDAGDHFWIWLVEYGRLAYSKGMLIALMMDVQLRAGSGNRLSLLGFMKHLDRKLFSSGTRISEDTVRSELSLYSGRDWTEFLREFVLGNSRLPTNRFIAAGGMHIDTSNCPRTDLGMMLIPHFCSDGSPCGYRANAVDRKGPAFEAGIRDGEVFSHWEPPIFQKVETNSPLRFGSLLPDGSISWRRFTTRTKKGLCRQLSFSSRTDRLARQIRRSIWNG